ncbi:MAG: vWA domain-containing protein [Anaerovoracaceae bacterium]
MKKDLTELVFILDKSGSMFELESDTIGGYNSMLKKQRSLDGKCVITTVLFDSGCRLLHDRIDIRAVKPITEEDYQTGGSTALLDAIGRTIHNIGTTQKNTSDEFRADKVLFVIITDGMENDSRQYTADQVKAMIERQKEKFGWEFIFLGANIDAVETAGTIGISANRAADYVADSCGIELNYRMMSEVVAEYRQNDEVSDEALEAIRRDEKRRSGRR